MLKLLYASNASSTTPPDSVGVSLQLVLRKMSGAKETSTIRLAILAQYRITTERRRDSCDTLCIAWRGKNGACM